MSESALRFGDLGKMPIDGLYSVFMEAFSDYAVPMSLSIDDFMSMHARRGVVYSNSVGAFDGDSLVGFIFNGDGCWGGSRCAYDAGTGIVPSHRGRGISKALAGETSRFLKERGFTKWLLEVLTENEKAIRTYEGTGFGRTRRFSCPEGVVRNADQVAKWASARTQTVVRDLGCRDTRRFAGLRDWDPSWQNSDASIKRSPEKLIALGAYGEACDEPMGYIVATDKGSVCQFAVREDARRRGIGTSLIAELALRVPERRIRYVNVQSDDEGTLGALGSLGVEGGPAQWEMTLEL